MTFISIVLVMILSLSNFIEAVQGGNASIRVERLADVLYFHSVVGVTFNEDKLPQNEDEQNMIKDKIMNMMLESVLRCTAFSCHDAVDSLPEYSKLIPFTEKLYVRQTEKILEIINHKNNDRVWTLSLPDHARLVGFMQNGQLVAHVNEHDIYVWDFSTLIPMQEQIQPLSLLGLLDYIRLQNA